MEIGDRDVQQQICEGIDDPSTFLNFAQTCTRNALTAAAQRPSKKLKFRRKDIYQTKEHAAVLHIGNGQGNYRYIHQYHILPNGVKHGQETIWLENENIVGAGGGLKFITRNWDTGVLHGPATMSTVFERFGFKLAEMNFKQGLLDGEQRIYIKPHPTEPGMPLEPETCEYTVLKVNMIGDMIKIDSPNLQDMVALNKIMRSGSVLGFIVARLSNWRYCDVCRASIYPDVEYYHCWECEDYDNCLNCYPRKVILDDSAHTNYHEMRRFDTMYSNPEMDRLRNPPIENE
jgi:hypothetical protein